MSLPYDRPSDPAKRHSAALTDGPDRAGRAGMLKAVGFTDEDLAKPWSGSATEWIETMPCNLNQRDLAVAVKEGIRAAGGTPMEFNTISRQRRRDDGHRGHEGIPRQSRGRRGLHRARHPGHLFDGLVCLFGCDKTGPGAAMATGRLDIPTVVLYSGTILPGQHNGQGHRRGQHLRGDRRLPRGQDHAATSCTRSSRRPARRRRLRRPVHGEHDVHGPGVPGPVAGGPQRHPCHRPGQNGRGSEGRRAGHGPRAPRHPAVVHRDPASHRQRHRGRGRDRWLHQRRAPPAGHRPRVRHPAGHRRLRHHLVAARRSSRTCAPAAVTGRWSCTRRAASSWSCASCSRRGNIDGDAPTVDGRTLAPDRRMRPVETPGQAVVKPIDTAHQALRGAWPSCRG